MTAQKYILTEKNDDSLSSDNQGFPGSPDLLKYNKRLIIAGSSDWVMDIYLPLSIFNNYSLSALETVTKYIKEEVGLNYREIAFILNRNERTIWGAYQSSKKKMSERFLVNYSKFYVPIYIFKDRLMGVLEVLTEYLKENLNLRYCQIASLLNRDDRTIWTVYNRAKRKRKIKMVKNVLP